MMSEQNWLKITLRDICDVKSGVGFPIAYQGKSTGQYPVYKVGDVSQGVLNNNGVLTHANNYISADDVEKLKATIFRAGTTLFAKIGEAVKLNRRAIVEKEGISDNNVSAVIPNLPEMDKFIFYFLRTIDLTEISKATTVPSVRKADLEELFFWLPPLAEQQQIAKTLDRLLAEVTNAKAELEAALVSLKQFRQSVLAAAVSGELTAEWRTSNASTFPWNHKPLSQITLSISDGDHQAPPKADKGIPFLVISNVSSGKIELEKASRWVPEEYFNSLKDIRVPRAGDLLYTVTGSYGIPIEVNTNDKFCFQRHIAIIKPDAVAILQEFLFYALGSQHVLQQAHDLATGTAQKTVSLKSLRSFDIPLPSLLEQEEIVRQVQSLFTAADIAEQETQAALDRVNNLTQSILAKAFRGELTAKWREETLRDNPELITGENSAKSLLAKIKAEREAKALAEKEAKKKTTRKKVAAS